MTRVLLVGRGAPERGGISAFMEGLTDALTKRYDIDLLNLTPQERTSAGRLTGGNVRRTLADARSLWRAAASYDLVHIHTALVPGVTLVRATLLILAARLRRTPVVVHVHSGKVQLWLRGGVRRLFARAGLRGANVVVAVSHGAFAALRQAVAPVRLRLVENGVDIDRFHPAPEPHQGPPRVLYVGLLTPRKGLLDLFEASRLLRARGVAHELIVAGGTPDEGADAEREVTDAARELEGVRLLGVRGHDAMPEVYAAAEVFCLPSWWEAMPLTLLEAMASGLPVVATAVGDVPRMVDEGVSGLLVEPRDPEALAAALATVLADPRRAAELAAAGREAVARRYRSEQTWAALAAIYDGLSGAGQGDR